MIDAVLNIANKYITELYYISEGKTWCGNPSEPKKEQIHSNVLGKKLMQIFGLSEIQSKHVVNTWLMDNGLSMLELDEYWQDQYWGEKSEVNVGYAQDPVAHHAEILRGEEEGAEDYGIDEPLGVEYDDYVNVPADDELRVVHRNLDNLVDLLNREIDANNEDA